MPTIVVVDGGPTGKSFVADGITFYEWTWIVEVDGQQITWTQWVDTNDPAAAPGLEQTVVDEVGSSYESDANPPDGADPPDGNPYADGWTLSPGDYMTSDDGDDDGAANSSPSWGDSI